MSRKCGSSERAVKRGPEALGVKVKVWGRRDKGGDLFPLDAHDDPTNAAIPPLPDPLAPNGLDSSPTLFDPLAEFQLASSDSKVDALARDEARVFARGLQEGEERRKGREGVDGFAREDNVVPLGGGDNHPAPVALEEGQFDALALEEGLERLEEGRGEFDVAGGEGGGRVGEGGEVFGVGEEEVWEGY